MEELKLGKITLDELASWFYINKTNLSKHKKKFMNILTEYCDFEPVYGGVIVNKIYESTYVKNPNLKIVLDNIDKVWCGTGLDTCSHVGKKIYQEHEQELTVAESTTINHTTQARNKKWGKPNSEEGGPEGKCSYMLCRKDNKGKPIYLTSEQEQIKQQLLKKWFGDADEKTVIIQMMIDNGEIKPEEAWGHYSNLLRLPKCYPGFMKEFRDLTGVQLIRGTQVDRKRGAWDIKEEEAPFEF